MIWRVRNAAATTWNDSTSGGFDLQEEPSWKTKENHAKQLTTWALTLHY